MKKLYAFLTSVQPKQMLVKAICFSALVFGAMFWLPLIFITVAFVCTVIAFERNFRSVYYVVFLLPFDAAFYLAPLTTTLPVIYGFFILFHLALYICKVRKSILKDRVFIVILVVVGYAVFSPLVFGVSTFWANLTGAKAGNLFFTLGALFILYLTIKNKEQLEIKNYSLFIVAGILLSAIFGFFIRLGSRGQGIMRWHYTGSGARYFGLINVNPNVFHMIILCAIFCLFALSIKKQIGLTKLLPAFVALGFFGVLTMSRTFYIAFTLLVSAFIIIKIADTKTTKKQKAIFLGLILLATVVTLAMTYQHVINTFDRMRSILDTYPSTDGEHLYDPGRRGLMLRYLRGWYQNVLTIIFGNGIGSAYPLPSLSPHNMYIFLLWGGGIIGLVLVASALVSLFITAFNKKGFRENLGVAIIFLVCFGTVTMTETLIITPAFPIAFISFFLFVSTAGCPGDPDPLKNTKTNTQPALDESQ